MSTDPDHSELQNGSPKPESEPSAADAAAAAAAAPQSDGPDLQQPDPSGSDAQLPDSERSGEGEVLPVNAEASNYAPEGEISTELSDADSSRAALPNREEENDSKVGSNAEGEGSRTFTMRELLSELKNGDAGVNDGRESSTPQRLVNCIVNVIEGSVILFNLIVWN